VKLLIFRIKYNKISVRFAVPNNCQVHKFTDDRIKCFLLFDFPMVKKLKYLPKSKNIM